MPPRLLPLKRERKGCGAEDPRSLVAFMHVLLALVVPSNRHPTPAAASKGRHATGEHRRNARAALPDPRSGPGSCLVLTNLRRVAQVSPDCSLLSTPRTDSRSDRNTKHFNILERQ